MVIAGMPIIRFLTDKTLNLCFSVSMTAPIGLYSSQNGWCLVLIVVPLPGDVWVPLIQELLLRNHELKSVLFRTPEGVITKSECD